MNNTKHVEKASLRKRGIWLKTLLILTIVSSVGSFLFWQDLPSSEKNNLITFILLPIVVIWGTFLYAWGFRRLYMLSVFLLASWPAVESINYLIGNSDWKFTKVIGFTFIAGGGHAILLLLVREMVDTWKDIQQSSNKFKTLLVSNIWLVSAALVALAFYFSTILDISEQFDRFGAISAYIGATVQIGSLLLLCICGLALWTRRSHQYLGSALLLMMLWGFSLWYPQANDYVDNLKNITAFNVSLIKFVGFCVFLALTIGMVFRNRFTNANLGIAVTQRGFYFPVFLGVVINGIAFVNYEEAQISIPKDFMSVKFGFHQPITVGDSIDTHLASIRRGDNYIGGLDEPSSMDEIDGNTYTIERHGVTLYVKAGTIVKINLISWSHVKFPDGMPLNRFSTRPAVLVSDYGSTLQDWFYPLIKGTVAPSRRIVFREQATPSGTVTVAALLAGDGWPPGECHGDVEKGAYCLRSVDISLEGKAPPLYDRTNGPIDLSPLDVIQTEKAAKKGDANAQFALGSFYSSGLYQTRLRYDEAFKWYLAAAKQNNTLAQVGLAGLYEDGKGVPKNPFQAYVWYRIANLGLSASAAPDMFSTSMYRVSAALTPDQITLANSQAAAWRSAAGLNINPTSQAKVENASNNPDVKAISACTNGCPYFPDFYSGNLEFQKSLLSSLESAGISKPNFLPDGVTSPLTPVVIGKETYLSGSVCEPHNCGPHQLVFLYLESQERTVGVYQSDENISPIWFGNPSSSEKEKINERFNS